MDNKIETPTDFTPEMGNYNTLRPFRYWCQKVLPLVYDDSLSYYEVLCKVVDYLNKTMEDVETLNGDVTNLHTAYVQLQNYVNNYFSSLDVQQEINNKLDIMAEDGTLTRLFGENIMLWDSTEGNILVNAKISTSIFDGYSQGMCSDGTYIYLTYRKSLNNNEAMHIAKLNTSFEVVADYNVGSGHFNNLYYYDGVIYASGSGLNSAGNPDYGSFSMFDASTLAKIRDVKVPVVGAWGVGLHKFQNITAPAFFINQQNTNCFDVYTGFSGQYTEAQTLSDGSTETIKIQDNQKEYTPLTRIVLKTGNLGVWQGAFKLTQNYILTVESVLGKEAPHAKNRIGVYEYNGNNHCYIYLPSAITEEIEDIEVIDSTVYVNTARCKIVTFTMPTFYHGYDTQINAVNALNGLVKNAYLNVNNLDRYRIFNGVKIYGEHFLNELVYVDELTGVIGDFNIQNRRFPCSTSYNNKRFRFSGSYYFNSSFVAFNIEYAMAEKSNNYVLVIDSAQFNIFGEVNYKISGNRKTGDLFSNPTVKGSIANVFYLLASNGWLDSDVYINRLRYTVSLPDNYTGFKLEPDGKEYSQGSAIDKTTDSLPIVKSHIHPYAAEKWLFLGDSICFRQTTGYGYPDVLNIADYVNLGTAQATMRNGDNSVQGQFDKIPADFNYGYVMIEGGYNDWYATTDVLGTIESSTNDRNTVVGGLVYLFRKFFNRDTPPTVYYLFVHNINETATKKNGTNKTMQEYHDTIKKLCISYGVVFIDCFEDSGLCTYYTNSKKYTVDNDGIHPTLHAFEKFYKPVILNKINWINTN